MHQLHEALGARFGEAGGREVPRNYGDPSAEYQAVRHAAGLVDRWDRVPVRVYGRDPVKMVQGLITNDLAGAPEGVGIYAALLTPKGKMIADLRALRRANGEVLLDLDAGARGAALEHLKKFVPPLFARFEDLGDKVGVLGVYGPEARGIVARVLGVELPPDLPEEGFVEGSFEGEGVLALHTEYTGEDGYDLFAPVALLPALWTALAEGGARPVGHATLEVLRIEAGRARWGAELDETVIPLEAELKERAISQTKGCYTGQEVIVRILHRGHVNRHLRGLLLGDMPAPAAGTPLHRPGEAKVVGTVTSACTSPLYDQTIALAYVRREVEPPATLRLGSPEGEEVRVYELPIPLGA